MKKIIIFLIMLLFTSPVAAQEICLLNGQPFEPKKVANLDQLKDLVVLEDGRIKPFDSFARNFLLRVSGKTRFNEESATEWMGRFLLATQTTRNDKIFLINNPTIAEALSIEEEKKRRYSFSQIEPSFARLQELAHAAHNIDQKKRDIVEAEIIRLFENVSLYSQLSLSFSFAFPHPDFTVTDLKTRSLLELSPKTQQFSFIDIAQKADVLHKLTKSLETKPQIEWTIGERELITLVTNMFQWSLVYQSIPFAIIPSFNSEEEWLSPWDAMSTALTHPDGRGEILALADVMIAYWNGAQLEFDLAIKNFQSSVAKRAEGREMFNPRNIALEIVYNQINVFLICKFLYFIAFGLFLVCLIRNINAIYRLAGLLLWSGLILQTGGLIMRMMILQRPPVSTLYETFVFVGFVSVLAGLIIERVNKNWLGYVTSAISGFVFLIIASKFAMEGDTLQMLVAVLNSNFWLSTHVISITIGYAGACVAGIIGHVYILQAIFHSQNKDLLSRTYKTLVGALGFALIMTFLGTNLGGIWADQSWGRFWGWDPKENGALLIILWLVLLLHAKIGRMIGPLGLAVGSAASIIVVMWAWFGVNLLSVGLHSYGFTSGLAMNLTIYLVLQLLFLFIATPIALQKLKKKGK